MLGIYIGLGICIGYLISNCLYKKAIFGLRRELLDLQKELQILKQNQYIPPHD